MKENKPLPQFLLDERMRLMQEMKKRGFNHADIGRVFRMTRQHVFLLFPDKKQEENKGQ